MHCVQREYDSAKLLSCTVQLGIQTESHIRQPSSFSQMRKCYKKYFYSNRMFCASEQEKLIECE